WFRSCPPPCLSVGMNAFTTLVVPDPPTRRAWSNWRTAFSFHQGLAKVMIQFVSHVAPPSSEKACSHRGDPAPLRVQRNRHSTFLPSAISSPKNSPTSPKKRPVIGGRNEWARTESAQ